MNFNEFFNEFFNELKRRSEYKLAVTYAVIAWLVLQVVYVITPMLETPEWLGKTVLILLLVGFPIALVLAWAFEMSPEGMVRISSESGNESREVIRRVSEED